jgi:uncharacterized protein (DUF2252 family)
LRGQVAANKTAVIFCRRRTQIRGPAFTRGASVSESVSMKMPSPEQRADLLDRTRALKMARSAHAYVRGNTRKFYEWLADEKVSQRIPVGPEIWICGDCHLGNLGPIVDRDGAVEVQIRDLDQAVIGNPAHDLIRLGLSLATAARGSDLPGVTTARMVEEMVEGYGAALRDPGDDAGPEPDAVRSVRRRALGRRWRHLARERLDDIEPTIPLGAKFWPLEARERAGVAKLVEDRRVADMIVGLDGRSGSRKVELSDAAYWMKGCSSLGLLRVAAIVALREGRRVDHALVDVKQAVAPLAPSAKGAAMPTDAAQRVVAAARALSPYLGGRMVAGHLLDHSVFVRELAPQDLKLEVEQFSRGQAVKAARYLSFVVGKAHARQMDDATRHEWAATLDRGRSKSIDAPSWLWDSIVALAGRHETGYLEHCRRFADSKPR